MTKYFIPYFVEEIPEKENLIQDYLYISEKYKTATHLCMCGCGEIVVTPLGNKDNERTWELIKKDTQVSLDPSIGNNNLNCHSHYWLTNNQAIIDRTI